jgi:hypothetical protein
MRHIAIFQLTWTRVAPNVLMEQRNFYHLMRPEVHHHYHTDIIAQLIAHVSVVMPT